ncbi:MAG TPA: hypothetical protein VNF68_15235 [Candidatus Baltobacteraceae bacterium]|nr:hypothetical protein [Candidatus Baltobacteraceae bacterium]
MVAEQDSLFSRAALRNAVKVPSLVAAFLLLAATLASHRSWENGVSVQIPGAPIKILAVSSDYESDYDVIDHRQGSVYFDDCLRFSIDSKSLVRRVQFYFALVDVQGTIRRPPLPVDVRFRSNAEAPSSVARGACRRYAYENGIGGLWLTAWVNEVDFEGGTSWHAPPRSQMQSIIYDALPQI